MKTKFELGEEVFFPCKVVGISLNDTENKPLYIIEFKTTSGNALTMRGVTEDQLERVVQG